MRKHARIASRFFPPLLRPAAAAIGICGGLLLLLGCAHISSPRRVLSRFEFEEPQMGVPFRIVLYAPDQETARAAARSAYDRVANLNAIMSDYEYDSELSRLSRTAGSGVAVRVSDELWRVLARAQKLARATDGAFDVTVGPCVALWRKARREKLMPRPDLLERARDSTGYVHLQLDSRRQTATLQRKYMRLDLGGIAKGFAVDEALRTLRAAGVRRALVAASGDIALGDPPPDRKGWQIALASAEPSADPTHFIVLCNAAVATSGDMFQFLEVNGVRYSHILDPRTCLGLTDQSLVTVIARDGLTADSLATAISVLGPERGLRLARDRRVRVRFVRRAGTGLERVVSPGFPESVPPVR